MSIKVIITTSDKYHHLLPIFFKLYVREWNWPCELVGYKKPVMELPECCTWVSLGVQRGPKYFSDDLRPYFEKQPDWFVWLFEDSFIKHVDRAALIWLMTFTYPDVGRICLSREGMNRKHKVIQNIWFADPDTNYRISTQPSIWNKKFLLKYLTPGLTPWTFEKQQTKDSWQIIGPTENVVTHNEGTTKHDIHKLNLEGIEL